MHRNTGTGQEQGVLVFAGEEEAEATRQPTTFQCGPSGLQLYTPKPIQQFKILNLKFILSDDQGSPLEISCSGVVVDCQKEQDSSLYHLWVKFLDLTASARRGIQLITKMQKAYASSS